MDQNYNKTPLPPQFNGTTLSDSTHFEGTVRSAAMFRWWIPAGFLTEAEIEREIRTIAEHGFRGLEICVNMADTGYTKQQRAQYGWGTPHWKKMYRFILETANRYGVQIDTTISPGWPAGVPGICPEDDCAAKEMNTCTSAPFSGEYVGPVPTVVDTGLVNPERMPMPMPHADGAAEEKEPEPENHPVLVAVTAARIVGVRQVPMTGGRFGPPSVDPNGPKTSQYLLDPDSLQTVPYFVDEAGVPSVRFCGEEGQWLLFGFWMRGSAQTNRQGSATAWPCYAIDHFNRIGAQAVIDFWEANILDDQVRTLLRENGGVIFEDSIELDISDYAIHWSPRQLELFQSHCGFDLTPYLPLLTGLTYMDPKSYKYELATPSGEMSDLGSRLRNDYCQFLTEIYSEEHILPIQRWAAGLGMGYRSQGYGLPFDLTAIAAVSHGPEGESLGFGDGVRGDDRFRTISGGAHMAKRPIISDEMGAVAGEGYRWTWRSMLKWMNKNMAGGANLIIFHGMPYAVSDSSKWPGYSPFGFGLAGQWGPRQPEWEYIDGLGKYLSRTQAILQAGHPQVDIAILKVYYEGFNFAGLMPDQTLAQAGYTYDFITPNTLQLDPVVRDGRLSPDGPGYRALVLDGEVALEPDTITQLMECAKAGLKIVICGDVASHTPFFHDKDQDDLVFHKMSELLSETPNVCQVASTQDLKEALMQMGIYPALMLSTPTDMMSVHRKVAATDYYFVFHRDAQGCVPISLEGTGTVYELDPWDGSVTKIPACAVDDRMELSLKQIQGQTRILAMERGTVKDVSPLTVKKTVSIGGPWTLSVERWERDDNGQDTTATRKTDLQIGETALKPWTEIPMLGSEVSGIGSYRTELSLDIDCPIARIAFTDVRCQSVHLFVNGKNVPVDHHTMTAKVNGLLHAGRNQLDVRVVTTLGNQLIAYGAFPQMPWLPEPEKPVAFGLCGEVLLQIY